MGGRRQEPSSGLCGAAPGNAAEDQRSGRRRHRIQRRPRRSADRGNAALRAQSRSGRAPLQPAGAEAGSAGSSMAAGFEPLSSADHRGSGGAQSAFHRAVRRRAARVAEVEISAELEAAAAAMPPAGPANVIDSAQETPELTPEAKALLLESQDGDAERIRQLAQRDMAATANVLRMWLDQKA